MKSRNQVMGVFDSNAEAQNFIKEHGESSWLIVEAGNYAGKGAPEEEEATIAQFASSDKVFLKACELAGVDNSRRQASKFQNGHGSAFRFRQQAIREVSA